MYCYTLFYSKTHESPINPEELHFVTMSTDLEQLFVIMVKHEIEMMDNPDLTDIDVFTKYYVDQKSNLSFTDYVSPICGKKDGVSLSNFITCRGDCAEIYQITRLQL